MEQNCFIIKDQEEAKTRKNKIKLANYWFYLYLLSVELCELTLSIQEIYSTET